MIETKTVRASELGAVIAELYRRRNPEKVAKALRHYKRDLAQYKRRLGKKKETTSEKRVNALFITEVVGFVTKHMGQEVFVPRPEPLRCGIAYLYMEYERDTGLGSTKARTLGLLADAKYNRDLRPQRVDEYRTAMKRGEWHDLLSDPITITEDGQVVNGQHRLAAVSLVDWSEAPNDPLFLVIFGVDPQEAIYADGSRRTAKDEAMIARKVAAAA